MCGNRVEELESQVKELQASVEGLTDELVESKVRIRELEAAVDEELGFIPELSDAKEADGEEDIREPEPGEAGEMAEASKTEGTDNGDSAEEVESDIIVA